MSSETVGVNPAFLYPKPPINPSDPTERFIQTGRCILCGLPVGNLKSVSHLAAYAGFPSSSLRLVDKVLYHISPIMTKATIQCPPK